MLQDKFKNFGVVILAAGKGTRLNCTDIPKVMLEIGGKPIVSYTVDTLKKMGFSKEQIVMVVGFQKEKVENYFGDNVSYAHQEEKKGTAHAAYTGMVELPENIKDVLVLGGDDSAFYTRESLETFIEKHMESGAKLSLLSAEVEDPSMLGRVVRHPNGDIEVIEKEYLTDEQKEIKEISTGTFCFDRDWFEDIFPKMPPLRKLGEWGLPTALAMARDEKVKYQVVKLKDSDEWFGVNTKEQLEEADRRKKGN
ncbi:MAG: NTP transferase domain-containing protein [Candidatus Magasanikbacteria bacterium]|nr:NTP transferase domain-containing protein [Candidatus Magasanikbacteria bacterium]